VQSGDLDSFGIFVPWNTVFVATGIQSEPRVSRERHWNNCKGMHIISCVLMMELRALCRGMVENVDSDMYSSTFVCLRHDSKDLKE